MQADGIGIDSSDRLFVETHSLGGGGPKPEDDRIRPGDHFVDDLLPFSGEQVAVSSPLPPDLQRYLDSLD